MAKVTIITPTFNRESELVSLYNSLKSQTNHDFIWMIIDDGSTDNTKTVIDGFDKEKFSIKYIYKKNGGKHTALNVAFANLETEIAFIVDSDDYLEEGAISVIVSDWQKYVKGKKNICGLVYKRKNSNGSFICDDFGYDIKQDNYNSFIINRNISGDKCEVFKSSILSKYRFPEFKNEKFMGEGFLWSKMARAYDMVFINDGFYVCEYLNTGLTKSGRKFRIQNPRGGMCHAEEYLDKIYSFRVREKNALLYLTYSFFIPLRIRETISKSNYKLFLIMNIIPSVLLYFIWKNKYNGDVHD